MPFSSSKVQKLHIADLSCEYKTNPLGIDETRPRLSWKLQSGERGILQTACHIRVALHEKDLSEDKNTIWDTGKVASEQSVHIPFQGPRLQSRQRYYWQVKVWDNKGRESAWSDPAFWEMGLLSPSDWQAKWIRAAWEEDVSRSQPAHLLRKEFDISKPLRSARAYITSLGLYEAAINGARMGDQVFTPGWTNYLRRLQYQSYDITALLKQGANAVGIMLGDGWYRGNIGWKGERNFYGNYLALLLQIEITYQDGTGSCINSDESWKATTGPIISSDIYNGEIYDARLEKAGWLHAAYDDADWSLVEVFDHPKKILIAPVAPPVRKIQEIRPIKIIKTPKGETVADMSQNMVGRLRIKVKGETGTTLKLSHAETLDKDGNFYTANLRSAGQLLQYTLHGKGIETYEPFFTFMGFRYVKVEGWPGELSRDDLLGIVVHTSLTPTGSFSCSSPLINRLQHNIQWGQKGNFLDVPTDCPQRDERMGWTGDAQVFARTAAFNMEVATFFTKWLADLALEQDKDGMVPHVIPNVLEPQAGGAAGWADAATIIPWNMYLLYGDQRILERQYNSMKAWVNYMKIQAGEDFLWNEGEHFGDWLSYMPADDYDGRSAVTDKHFLAQAFFAHSTDIVRKTAKVLGEKEDYEHYARLLSKIKKAFLDEYSTATGRLVSGTQTAYTLALHFDLLPQEMRSKAAARLAANIEQYGGHLTTGFLGTSYISHVLSKFGHLDKAYALLEQEDYPSWLYPVKKGATTIWERWDGIKPDGSFQNPGMNSFNHYAYGAIGDWMYRVPAGINPDEKQPGYKHIIIAPRPGGTISNVSASYRSLYGLIKSEWQIRDHVFHLRVDIPPNTIATLLLPNASMAEVTESDRPLEEVEDILGISQSQGNLHLQLGSGSYAFRVGWKE